MKTLTFWWIFTESFLRTNSSIFKGLSVGGEFLNLILKGLPSKRLTSSGGYLMNILKGHSKGLTSSV